MAMGRFNLMREESEGYSKLVTELASIYDSTTVHQVRNHHLCMPHTGTSTRTRTHTQACPHVRSWTRACKHAWHANMHACKHARVHAYAHTYARIRVCTCMHIDTCSCARANTCMHTRMHARTHDRTNVRMLCTRACTHACSACMNACMHECMPTCMCHGMAQKSLLVEEWPWDGYWPAKRGRKESTKSESDDKLIDYGSNGLRHSAAEP